jgi:hypothetical protein
MKDRAWIRLPAEDRPAAFDAWWDAIREYPTVYWHSSWQMFTRQIGWSGSPLEAHYPTNVTSDAFPPRSVRLSELSSIYLELFDGGDWRFGGLVHRPWVYVVVAAIAGLRFGRDWPCFTRSLRFSFR